MRRRCTHIAILALLTAAFAGCQRDPWTYPDGEPIRFAAQAMNVSSSDTKALALNGVEYLVGDGHQMALYGVWQSGAPGNDVTDLFDNQLLTCSGSPAAGYSWDYWPTRYWDKAGSYDFRAVYPATADADRRYYTDDGKLVVNYSMHVDEYDLLVASAQRMQPAGGVGTVDLNFQHALSALRFEFYRSAGSETEYHVRRFELQYVHSIGMLTYQEAAGEPVALTSWLRADARTTRVLQWEVDSNENAWPVAASGGTYTAGEWYYAIPQELYADDGVHPSVRFGVTVGDDDTVVYTTLRIPETGANDAHLTWDPGKKYIYRIEIKPTQSTISVEVKDWDVSYVSVDDIVF